MTIKRSLVVPALDEAGLIVSTLNTIRAYLKKQGWLESTEVVVVAAKGVDNTAELVKPKAKDFPLFQLIEPGPKVGKGRDVRVGVQAAHGELIVFTDADLATPIKHLVTAFDALESGGYDMVAGTRNLWKAHKGLKRKLMSVVANWLVRVTLLPSVPDSQCGFKGFTKPTAELLFSRASIDGWAFDMEILTIARLHHLKIGHLMIDDWHDPKLGKGLVSESPLAANIRTLKELWRIRKQERKGQYK